MALLGLIVLAAVIYSEWIVRPVSHGNRVVVTYWEKWTSVEADAMRDVVNDFNRSQDKIFVNYLSVSDIDAKTILATASGIPPDLAGLAAGSMPRYVEYDAATDLTEMAKEGGLTRSHYIPACYDICTMDGRLYALPTTPATIALHYNKTLLQNGGWDPNSPPKTIEQLDAMDRKLGKVENGKILEAGFMPSEPGWWSWVWPYFFGGSLYDEKTHKVTADRPENVRGYAWMASYAKRYGPDAYASYQKGFGNFDSPTNGFINGKLASELQGVWMANFIAKNNKNLKWGVVPFPYPQDRPDLKDTTVCDMDIIIMPAGAPHPKEAFEFLKFMQSQPEMEELCLKQKKFSPLAVESAAFERAHPNPYVKFFRDLCFGKNVVYSPKTPIWGEMDSQLGPLIDEMNLGTKTAAEAMHELQEKAQALQDDVDEINAERKAAGK